MKKQNSKATKTRKRREAFLKQYKDIAKQNRIRLDYNRVKKIDELARSEKTSFKKAFEQIKSKKEKTSIKYVEKKFDIDYNPARKIYILSINKEIDYKDSFDILKLDLDLSSKKKGLDFPILTQNYLDLIDFTMQDIVKQDATINISLSFYSFDGTVKQFNEHERFNFRKALETQFTSTLGNEGQDNGYAVLDTLLSVETIRDNTGAIEHFNVTETNV